MMMLRFGVLRWTNMAPTGCCYMLILVLRLTATQPLKDSKDGNMWLNGTRTGIAVVNTTVHGVCNATSHRILGTSGFNSSYMIIRDFRGNNLSTEDMYPLSEHSIGFRIPNIQKSQYGKYKCYLMMPGETRRPRLITDLWIHVGALYLRNGPPNKATFGTNVQGACSVSDKFRKNTKNFDVKSLVIFDPNNKPKGHILHLKPIYPTYKLSDNTLGFNISRIKKSSFGYYRCYYTFSANRKKRLAARWIYVGAKPMEPKLPAENVIVYNWEMMTITAEPSIKEQNNYTHNQSDHNRILDTHCQIYYNYKCSHMPYVRCKHPRNTTTCNVTDHRDLSSSGNTSNNLCVKVVFWNEAFGNVSKEFIVDLAKRVKPSAVEPLKTSVHNGHVSLVWKKPHLTHHIVYRVLLEAKNINHKLRFDKLTSTRLNVTGLIPHGEYHVTVTATPKYGGIESDPVVTTVFMPPDVPAQNPKIIGTVISDCGDNCRQVTVYWEKIPERKRNGEIEIHIRIRQSNRIKKRSAVLNRIIPGDNTAFVSNNLEKTKAYIIELEAVSTDRLLGRNTSLQVSEVKIPVEIQVHPTVEKVEALTYNHTRVEVTWLPWSDRKEITIVSCKRGQGKQCHSKSPLRVVKVRANQGKAVVPFQDVNQIHVGILDELSSPPGLIVWSPCIYQQGEVPSSAPPANVHGESPQKLTVKVDEYSCDQSRAKVDRVEGHYCVTDDNKTCAGEPDDIVVKEQDFNKLQTYTVDHPGRYLVSLVAVSNDGRQSPKFKESVFVPGTPGMKPGEIAGVVVGILIGIILIVAFGTFILICYRRIHQEKVEMQAPQVPQHPINPAEGGDEYEELENTVSDDVNTYDNLLLSPGNPDVSSHVTPESGSREDSPEVDNISNHSVDSSSGLMGDSSDYPMTSGGSSYGDNYAKVDIRNMPLPQIPDNELYEEMTPDRPFGPSQEGNGVYIPLNMIELKNIDNESTSKDEVIETETELNEPSFGENWDDSGGTSGTGESSLGYAKVGCGEDRSDTSSTTKEVLDCSVPALPRLEDKFPVPGSLDSNDSKPDLVLEVESDLEYRDDMGMRGKFASSSSSLC